ncbi:MAG: tetratricopeptide repeat protein [Clostridia bacterium]
MKTFARLSAVLFVAVAGSASAAGDPGGSSVAPPKDPVLEKVAEATRVHDWTAAQAVLRDAVARQPRNADYHNLYAYTVRKGPNPDMSLVFKEYNAALEIDPKHRQAHEYLGEAYLMVGNVAKAREHLAQLDKLCFFPCSEEADLKKAIADYETKQAAK